MVVDTSALVAIVFAERDADRYVDALMGADEISVSAATLLEALIVVEAGQGPDATRDLELLLSERDVATVPVTREQALVAAGAWRRFGKGRHAAGLNFGDCFAYALAQELDQPLLFKGADFAQTDVRSAL